MGPITDAHLRDVVALEHLLLRDTQVEGLRLKELARLKKLRTLVLENTLVRDSGLSSLEAFTNLERLNLADNTIVVWTSDNGAPRRNPIQGSNAPLGGWGYSVAEGGMRVPAL